MKEITPYNSVQIDKELLKIKEAVDEHDNYFFCKDPVQRLSMMIVEIENVLWGLKDLYTENENL